MSFAQENRSTEEAASKRAAMEPPTLLLHNQLLGERLYWYSLARFLVVGGIVSGALFAVYVVHVQDLEVGKLLMSAGALAFYNLIVFAMVRPYRSRQRAESSYAMLTGVMHCTIFLDFLFLTLALWVVGGARSPFQAFYLFHVILASVFLSRRAAFVYTGLGYLLLAGLILGEWSKWIPSHFPAGAVAGTGDLDGRYVITLLTVHGLLFSLSALMLTGLVQLLRARERELHVVNARLEKISTLRGDFLQMLLHDLKSPVAVVAQNLFNLESQLHGRLSDHEAIWLERSQIRLESVTHFIEDLQVLAILESEDIRKQVKPVDLAKLLENVVAEQLDGTQQRRQDLSLVTVKPLPEVPGIERLLREAVTNLITNAIKYTPMGGQIVVRGHCDGSVKGVDIEVEDNGIGISIEDQHRLFHDFARAGRKTGISTDVMKSSGLGLSIVRRIAELHGGTVAVRSELNHGSTFTIHLPTV